MSKFGTRPSHTSTPSMVTSVYSASAQTGGANSNVTAPNTQDHIRKRKLVTNSAAATPKNRRPTSTNNNSGFATTTTSTTRRNLNKLIKFKNATINWLNGLPPIDYDSALYEFNADNEDSAASRENEGNSGNTEAHCNRKQAKFKGKIEKLKKLFKKKESEIIIEGNDESIREFQDLEETGDSDNFEKVGKVQNLEETQYLEIRSNVREIFLPPDVAGQRKFLRNLTPKMRKKFAETHPWTVSNEIRTAKYTIFNFIPKNLFEQFRRVANVYFLILIVLQGIPIFSNTNIFLAASPLVSILLVTGIKDAVEDWKRQKSDNLVNHSIVHVLDRNVAEEEEELNEKTSLIQKFRSIFRKKSSSSGTSVESCEAEEGWKRAFWKDIRVGDIVMIKNNESIPADIVVLSTSNPQGICYVETKNLDGETNLKIRQAPQQTSKMIKSDQLEKLSAVLQVEPPSTKLYTFNGKMILPTETNGSNSESQILDAEAFPITPDNLILRGCQIRNTEFVTGVVAYTGPHSKIIMNSGRTPSKRSRIEKQMNPQIILSFVLLFVICLTCAIMQGQYVGGSIAKAPYWISVYTTGAMSSPIFTGFLTFWSSLILFQTLVPISLYITVEICKLVQAAWIHWDLAIYYAERDQRAVPRSWNIADDLGQIEYIFSDKTGTLTRNVMEFRKCSIGGIVYGYLPESEEDNNSVNVNDLSDYVSRDQFNAMEGKMSECLDKILPYKYVPPSQMSFVDPALITDLLNLKPDGKEQSHRIKEFFFSLIICHTILIDKLGMTEEILSESQTENPRNDFNEMSPHLLQYQAQSPDEAALVKAARDLGFVFLGRDQDYLNLSILGEHERIQILSVIEFNSTRKRMSVIIRKSNGQICLISKGADSVIYERLKLLKSTQDESEKSNDTLLEMEESVAKELREINLKHLEKFAESGLRTLCFASRLLREEEYETFSFRHAEASTSMINRELLMDAVAEEYERELELLGSTAIEDRLQDGVPDTIANLQMAGIKIWVLTGDKLETAVNIGFSCRLLTKKMFLIMIKSDDATVEGTKKQLDEGFNKMSFASLNGNLDHLMETNYDDGYEEGMEDLDNQRSIEYALIIDGTSLKHALEDRQCRPVFLDLATNCKAVLCCRVSPLQKAKCVELIKKTRNAMTLAIGDGANDVSMIQEADVGIGIAGEEGMQAVMSSDYAIAQFSYLERLLLVHGRLSYVRTSKITLLCFCKNVSFVLVAFWFQIYCAFTAQYTYDYMYLLYFNMFFTMLPVLLLGMFDQQVSNEKLQKVPQLYQDGIKQKYYSMKLFLTYSLVAIYQSLVCYFLPQFIFQDVAVMSYGFPESKTLIGNVQAFAIILTINCFTAAHMERWNLIFISGMILTGLVFLAFLIVYLLFPFSDLYGSWGDFLTAPFWAALVLAFSVASVPTLLFPFVRGWIWPKQPTDIEIIREIESVNSDKPVAGAEADLEAGWESRNAEAQGTGHRHRFTLEDELMETVKAAQRRANSSETPANNQKWTHRGHQSVAVPEKIVPVLRAEGTSRLRTLTTSSNEFNVPESEIDGVMVDVTLLSNSKIFDKDDGDNDVGIKESKGKRGILGRSGTLKRIGQTFKFFNLRTGKMEKFSGFAFSQESGAGRTIAAASEEDLLQVKRPEKAATK